MSEPAQAAPLLPQQSLAPSAGAMLRAAREAAGLHIAALAVSLKIPVRKLEALETDRLDLLPDAVFARALASSVCRSLKVDPDPVLRLLPQVDLQQLSAYERGINAPFSSSGDMARASLMEQLSPRRSRTSPRMCSSRRRRWASTQTPVASQAHLSRPRLRARTSDRPMTSSLLSCGRA